MTLMATPLPGLMQDLLSTVKIGWRAERGRLNLGPSDSLAQRELVSDVRCMPGQRVYRLGREEVARDLRALARRLFEAPFASFAASSAIQANQAVLRTLLQPGDRVLCLPDAELETTLDTLYVSATTPRLVRQRAVRLANGLVDYPALIDQVLADPPRCIVAGYSSYTRHHDYRALRALADRVGAVLVIDISRVAGLIAAGLHPSPLAWADVLTGATHKSLQGPRGGFFMTRDEALFRRFQTVFEQRFGTVMPQRVQLGLLRCLQQARSPLQIAQQQLALDNARAMAEVFNNQKLHVLSGGTDIQAVVLDSAALGLTGRQANVALGRLGISLERRSDLETTSLMLCTLPVSARGMGPQACAHLASAIGSTLQQRHDLKTVTLAIASVDRLCADHPPLLSAMDHLLLQ